jgi:Tfp pilus assembly protein PilV
MNTLLHMLACRSRRRLGSRERTRADGCAPTSLLRAARARLEAERGFALIEVIVSALLVALIVTAVFTGFDVTNRASADERSRAAADSLAHQAEEQLRSESINALGALEAKPRVQTVEVNRTKFTITSTAKYIADKTATASCSSGATQVNYLQTTTEVTWPSRGTRPPVVASSVISPPPGTALLVSVTDASANPVPGATVSAVGSSSATASTSVNGCAALQLPPGPYEPINASLAGYVDPNWFAKTEEDIAFPKSAYLTAETTTKLGYRLAPAATLRVTFKSGIETVEGDSAVAYNTGMSTFKPIGTVGTYSTQLSTGAKVYPFQTKYTAYAGSCEADSPKAFESTNVPPEVLVPSGGEATVAVVEPPIKIKLMSGYASGAAQEGSPVAGEGSIIDIGTGCGNVRRTIMTNASGGLIRPALPYGKYTMCLRNGGRVWEGEVVNNTTTGPSSTTWSNGGVAGGVATIYLGYSPAGTPAKTKAGSTCP